MGTEKIPLAPNQQLIVTTQLLQVEAKIQPYKDQNKTTYDLILDLESKDVIVDINLKLPAPELAALITLLKIMVQEEIGNGKNYKIVTFTLSNDSSLKPLVPYLADFTFVKDNNNVDNSNFLVLMLTITKEKGNIYFNAPVLPEDQDNATLMSNKLFMSYFVKPGIVKGIKEQAKHPDDVDNEIRIKNIHSDAYPNELYQIYNTEDIDLDKDHDPWIDSIDVHIDENKKELYLYLDAKADATFLEIHVDSWVKSWQKFTVDEKESISLKQTDEDSGSSSDMEWWKWLIAIIVGVLTFGIGLIVTAIIYFVVSDNVPDLGGSFSKIGKDLVQWPNQKYVRLREVQISGNIVMLVDVQF